MRNVCRLKDEGVSNKTGKQAINCKGKQVWNSTDSTVKYRVEGRKGEIEMARE